MSQIALLVNKEGRGRDLVAVQYPPLRKRTGEARRGKAGAFALRSGISSEQARNTHDRGLLGINRAWVVYC